DSNKELGKVTAMHLKTVSDLITRLVDVNLLELMVDKHQSNKRSLKPLGRLLREYPSSTNRLSRPAILPIRRSRIAPAQMSTPYPSITDSPNSSHSKLSSEAYNPIRYCPVTGLDITHQRQDSHFAAQATLRRLLKEDSARFEELAHKLLSPEQANQGGGMRIWSLTQAIRKVGKVATS
ncbi:hypothetical protein, partial [Spirosoma terrae]